VTRGWLAIVFSMLFAVPLAASNGHLLQAVGAVGAGMGGAGTAEASDPLTALNLNPALLVDFEGTWVELGAEQLTARNAVESRFGSFHGRTEEAGDPALVPGVGFVVRKPGAAMALGGGLLGLAGVGVDYPQDATNPLLAPQPFGFGRAYSRYEYLRVPLAVAFRVRDDLSLGLAGFAGRATFSASPAGFATPDCGAGGCFFPSAAGDSVMSYGFQAGVAWTVWPRVRVGAAYTSRESASEFELESAVANPQLPSFGTRRLLELELSNPAVASMGANVRLTDHWRVAIDLRRIFYSDAPGFGDALLWRDIDVVAVGTEWTRGPLTVRAGFNRGDSPITSDTTFFNVASPAVFERHVTAGFGYDLPGSARLDLAVYRAARNRVGGPVYGPTGPIPGAAVTNEMELDSLVLGVTFKP
jgi:long-chain fatty acid transport protein